MPASGSEVVRLRASKCFPVCPRKRTYLPILELLPSPTLRERRHRGLVNEVLMRMLPGHVRLRDSRRAMCLHRSYPGFFSNLFRRA